MYPHFIELHTKKDTPFAVNIDQIVYADQGCISVSGCLFAVKESYKEIKTLIREAGCLIQKADPRLDTSRPLKPEELKDLVGDPVWNSNLGIWMLVQAYREEDGKFFQAELVMRSGESFYYRQDDFIKYPLYRMKLSGRESGIGESEQ